ncbi:MAG: hypothetical protein COX57_04325 [Alphaproteobacteria bacterium CG_4_10_14_0_2_um_filter_63_37]|nr:MAG: hypothetical protein AUJ55_07950 [Proteobacteria bacterium CG1_02_64_396]PJA25267.1 MAG: hypothetical protein COX57_04325 [Alphaproteobacteria bacterium CG_4_10_14_0_2_um_filter_63_37]
MAERLIGLKLPSSANVFFVPTPEFATEVGSTVLVRLRLGREELARVVTTHVERDEPFFGVIDTLIRPIADDELNKLEKRKEQERQALTIGREQARLLNLPMKFSEALLDDEGRVMNITFAAPHRVDFRALVRALAAKLHLRINLRQIGVRDLAGEIGGLGPCGAELCCASKLGGNMDPVSLKMAKNQHLSLNPDQISGVCGRLMCCLSFEDEAYRELNRSLPRQGTHCCTKSGQCGRVVFQHPLDRAVTLQIKPGENLKVSVDELEGSGGERRAAPSQDPPAARTPVATPVAECVDPEPSPPPTPVAEPRPEERTERAVQSRPPRGRGRPQEQRQRAAATVPSQQETSPQPPPQQGEGEERSNRGGRRRRSRRRGRSGGGEGGSAPAS